MEVSGQKKSSGLSATYLKARSSESIDSELTISIRVITQQDEKIVEVSAYAGTKEVGSQISSYSIVSLFQLNIMNKIQLFVRRYNINILEQRW